MSRPKSTKLDNFDNRLITLLAERPRGSNSSFARELGVSEKTVRVRLERLITDFGLKFDVSIGARSHASSRMLYILSCEIGDRFKLLNRLAAESAVESSYAVTGGAEIALLAAFDDDSDAFKFQHDILEPLKGVQIVLALRLLSEATSGATSRAMPFVDPVELNQVLLHNTLDMEVEKLLQWWASTLCNVFGADRSMVGVFGGANPLRLRPRLWHNIPEYYSEQINDLLHPEDSPGTIGSVARTQRLVYVRDALESEMFTRARDLIKRVGFRTIVSFPLKFGDSLVGIATLYFDEIRDLDDSYASTVQSFLDQVGLRLRVALRHE